MVEQAAPGLNALRQKTAARADIERIHVDEPRTFLDRVANRRRPAIVTGLMANWPATHKWSPAWFKQSYPGATFNTHINLPTQGVAYDQTAANHLQAMTMAAFIDGLHDFQKPAYVRRQYVDRFPGAERDVQFLDMVGAQGYSTETFLWIGTANTRTALHFDFQDGALAQFHGRKRVWLVSPADSKYVYPYKDSITKSQVCIDAPEYGRHPDFSRVTVHEGLLNAGELLFIPRRWWHAITALDVSISCSFSWGQKITARELASAVNAGGAGHWARVIRDFVVLGVLHGAHSLRLNDDPPFGKLMYQILSSAVRRRLSGHAR